MGNGRGWGSALQWNKSFLKRDAMFNLNRKLRVVIVDDHRGWRQTLRIFLASLPEIEIVGEAMDGEAALEVCQGGQPDLVLMDIHMPGMDGFETTRVLREVYPNLWVIGVSAEASIYTQQRAQEAGIRAGISKDMLLDYLVPAITDTMNAAR
jgi:DNA-binding NarL/FixJ family response regulator